jgi:peptidyl-prolyl cis-trans isomerase SurA
MASVVKEGTSLGKNLLLGFIFVFFLWCGLFSSSEAIVDRIVAVVNQEIITLSEVEKWAGPLKEEIRAEDRLERRERVHEVYRKVLERLIEDRLIEQEAKRSGIKVASKEIEGALEDIRRRSAVTQEQLEKALANEGMTLEAYKKEIEKRIQRMKLINLAVKMDSKAGEKEWMDYYQKNIDRYRSNESYRPSQILFSVRKDATPEEVREIRMKCQKVLVRIDKGEDFGEMAVLYSEDISAKDRGDLGYFKKGELIPELEKEALRLRVGEVSPIIRTRFGFHIIKLVDRKGDTPPPFEEVKEKVKSDYKEKEMEKAFQQFLSILKEKSVIEIKL